MQCGTRGPSQNVSDKLQSGIRDEGAPEVLAVLAVRCVLLPALPPRPHTLTPRPPPAGTWLPRYKAFNVQVVTEYKAAQQSFKLHNLSVQTIANPFKIATVFLQCLLFLKTLFFIIFWVCL